MSKPPPLPTHPIEWFYALQEQQHGPVTFDELTSLIKTNAIGRTTPVWHSEMTEWKMACEIEGLFTQPPPLPIKSPPPLLESPKTLENKALPSSDYLILCNECHYVGPPLRKQKGNYFICLILLMLLVIPGILYALWRIFSSRIRYCPQCNSEHVIPTHSVAARSKVKEFTENELKRFEKLALEEKIRIKDEVTAQVMMIVAAVFFIVWYFIPKY